MQIQQFEADIAKLHKGLEISKTTYQTCLKNYTDQCGTFALSLIVLLRSPSCTDAASVRAAVSEELRNAIKEKDFELREAVESTEAMRSDAEKVRFQCSLGLYRSPLTSV